MKYFNSSLLEDLFANSNMDSKAIEDFIFATSITSNGKLLGEIIEEEVGHSVSSIDTDGDGSKDNFVFVKSASTSNTKKEPYTAKEIEANFAKYISTLLHKYNYISNKLYSIICHLDDENPNNKLLTWLKEAAVEHKEQGQQLIGQYAYSLEFFYYIKNIETLTEDLNEFIEDLEKTNKNLVLTYIKANLTEINKEILIASALTYEDSRDIEKVFISPIQKETESQIPIQIEDLQIILYDNIGNLTENLTDISSNYSSLIGDM